MFSSIGRDNASLSNASDIVPDNIDIVLAQSFQVADSRGQSSATNIPGGGNTCSLTEHVRSVMSKGSLSYFFTYHFGIRTSASSGFFDRLFLIFSAKTSRSIA